MADVVRNLRIDTKCLKLRCSVEPDRPYLERAWTDPTVRKHLGGPLRPDVLQARRTAPIPGGSITVTAEHGVVVGFCHLAEYRRTRDLELSYEFLPEHWGNGFATEACQAVLDWSIANLDVPRVVSVTQAANARSRRLLERLGMHVVGTFYEWDALQNMYAKYRD